MPECPCCEGVAYALRSKSTYWPDGLACFKMRDSCTPMLYMNRKNQDFETGTAAAVPVFIIGRIQFHGAFIYAKQRSPRGGPQRRRLLRFSGKRYERTRDVRKENEHRGRSLRLLPVSHAPSRLAFRPERRGDLPLLSEADPMDRPFPAPLSGRKNAPWSLSPEA